MEAAKSAFLLQTENQHRSLPQHLSIRPLRLILPRNNKVNAAWKEAGSCTTYYYRPQVLSFLYIYNATIEEQL